jgi:CubicO group peptidase (beta-lactamase class C family)
MKKLNLIYWLIVMIVLVITSCKKDKTQTSPALSTTDAYDITDTTALVGGNISGDGNSTIAVRGVCWSTSSNPGITDFKVMDSSGVAFFAMKLGRLNAGTKYYARAFATNSVGTGYGNEITFTTNTGLPALATTGITNITFDAASGGGNISSDGGAPITERGIVWSTSSNPTIILATKTSDGTGTGAFASAITGLVSGTKYYAKAYATNSFGTGYGQEVTFQTVSLFAKMDSAIASKMTLYSIPAVSIAIVKDEKLVYVKSYGYANKEASIAATPNNLFRIASVSKTITAIAILKLVQDGFITLDQTVFGASGVLGNDYGVPPTGSGKDQITIRQLLEHKSGWTDTPDDPMFSNLTYTKSQLITSILMNRALTTNPGTTYYYLNFGYFVLGRVIEKIAGVSYDSYVKTSILQPCGISEMKISGNTLAEKYPNEVTYYQSNVSPYGMNVTRADASGGWIASPTDLARLIVKIDRNTYRSDLILKSLLNQFYFGYLKWAQNGSLPGTSAVLCRLNSTYSFSILANTRIVNGDDNLVNIELNSAVTEQINAMTSWPDVDLF